MKSVVSRWAVFALMCVSVPVLADEIRVSHCWREDSTVAINDGIEPQGPRDRPHHSFWPHKGTAEWVEYHFDGPRTVGATEVYWLDDTPGGGCPVPESWRLFYRKDQRWLPVEQPSDLGVAKGVFNRVTFKPVQTSALRIEVKSLPGCGSGIIEWDVRNDPVLTKARALRRQLARLEQLRFQPRQSSLLRLVQHHEGLSPAAEAYLARLAEYRRRSEHLAAQVKAGTIVEEGPIRRLIAQARGFLNEQTRQLEPIVFWTRHPLTRPNAANCYIWQSAPERWGCSIRTFDPAHPELPAKTIFSDDEGCIFDMSLSFDARTLFFSFKRQDEHCWQIHEIGLDGTGLKRISRDPEHHDVGAVELPTGELLFVSTRHGGYAVCQPGPASNLHVMARDGGKVRCVSQNTLADFSPHLLADGRVLFTRWEYIDRDLTYRQSLWTQNPDGRRYQLFFGNTIRDVGTFWQARPLPNHTDLLVATFAPHHGWPHGAIGLIHCRAGVEAPRDQGFAWITREFPKIGDRSFRWSYRDPFPVDDYRYLVAYGGGGASGRFGLYLLDICDNKVPIYADPEMGCYGPIAIRSRRRPPLVTAAAEPTSQTAGQKWASVLLADVYQGMPDLERGRIKFIQIMEQLRKTQNLRHRAYDQSPVMGYGTYYAKKCWGRVPVEQDGSAHFQVPALREVYLQVLDAEGRELQRMTSALQLMPGETQGCIGCHEHRATAPPATMLATSSFRAFSRAPVRPVPPAWGNNGVVDFVKLVQPVLDKYCVECHRGANPNGGYDLSGDKTRLFNMAYDNLLGRSRSYRQHDMAGGAMLAEEAACGASRWSTSTGSCAHRPPSTNRSGPVPMPAGCSTTSTRTIVAGRSPAPIANASTCGSMPMCPTTAPTSIPDRTHPAIVDLCTEVATGRDSVWFAGQFLPVYNRRCQKCHDAFPHPNDHQRIWDGRFAWINFTHPEWSPALVAHLSAQAGGRNLGTDKDGQGAALFRSTSDSDYQAMLGAIRQGRADMLAHPRVDQRGDQRLARPVALHLSRGL